MGPVAVPSEPGPGPVRGRRQLRSARRWPVTLAAVLAVLLAAVACSSAAPRGGPSASAAPASLSAPASASTASAAASGQDADWPTYDRTADRGGVSVSSPAAGSVRSSWTVSVDGPVYAQPLIVGSEVIIATENDTVYALNESTGAVRWSRHLASPVPSGLPCGDIDPSGITGTPVADVAAAGSGLSRSPASPPTGTPCGSSTWRPARPWPSARST